MADAGAADTAKRKVEPTSNGNAAEQIDLCGDEEDAPEKAEPGTCHTVSQLYSELMHLCQNVSIKCLLCVLMCADGAGCSAHQEMREFRVADANICPICMVELNADASTGQVRLSQHLECFKAQCQPQEMLIHASNMSIHTCKV